MLCEVCSKRAYREWATWRSWLREYPIPTYVDGKCPACRAEQPPSALLIAYPGPQTVRIPMRDGRAALDMARWLWGDRHIHTDVQEMPQEPVLRGHEERALAGALLLIYERRPRAAWLLDFLRSTGRVCPMPDSWVKVHRMLGGDAPNPLILGGWSSPREAKAERLAEHLRIAEERGVFAKVEVFLRGLPDDQWLWEPGKRPAREEARE